MWERESKGEKEREREREIERATHLALKAAMVSPPCRNYSESTLCKSARSREREIERKRESVKERDIYIERERAEKGYAGQEWGRLRVRGVESGKR